MIAISGATAREIGVARLRSDAAPAVPSTRTICLSRTRPTRSGPNKRRAAPTSSAATSRRAGCLPAPARSRPASARQWPLTCASPYLWPGLHVLGCPDRAHLADSHHAGRASPRRRPLNAGSIPKATDNAPARHRVSGAPKVGSRPSRHRRRAPTGAPTPGRVGLRGVTNVGVPTTAEGATTRDYASVLPQWRRFPTP